MHDAVMTAKLSGGYTQEVHPGIDSYYMDKFFESYLKGDTPEEANYAACTLVSGSQYLTLHKYTPTWTVNPRELIQSYIDKAMSGEIITILPGIFNENLVIDKSITLQGAGKGLDGTIIDGQDSGSVIRVVNRKGIPDPTLEINLFDLLIRNGLNFQGGGTITLTI